MSLGEGGGGMREGKVGGGWKAGQGKMRWVEEEEAINAVLWMLRK